MNALLKRVWIGLATTLIVSLAAVVLPNHVQIGDDGHIHLGAPPPAPSPSTAVPTPESTSPPLKRDAVEEVIRTAVSAAGLDPAQGRPTVAAAANSDRTGWMAVREKTAAQAEMNAICADLERQGWTLNPNGDRPDASRSYKRGGWYLLVSTRGKTQAPSTTSTLTDSQTYLTLTGLQLNLSDIPLPEITVRIG
ncbi:hypothetical protein Snoj_30000 [Streptomyces nojiriensis]|uniref:Secreted protein n=1 Tax=Streptomyces nojiriensis TaxID=66374 RepID=A0ABQ3SM09_9ACTN|nr:hypothetical protein [Streptomyces nojiriensis]QTI42665.1 hypothetical protein JYK04_00424 [Streptomyces nojiriensis]GGS15976.1 hypothetical protein GCM10010205_52180 [Streptomyces nojiriensis]GHI69082.1 hypothetical protein Snoj_30000 [Streptomyces nojiriensis]